MNSIRLSGLAIVAALMAAPVLAQGGPGAGKGPGPGMQGAGPAASMPGTGRGPGARFGADFTPGWAMMTEAERNEHHKHIREMKTYEECKAYMEQHHAQMAARAKERGGKALAQPRRDACAGLKP